MQQDKQEKEYFKLYTDLIDARQQLLFLLQHQMAVGDEIKAQEKVQKELDDELSALSKEEIAKGDGELLNKLMVSKSKTLVLLEIFNMYNNMYSKKRRKALEIQKRLEQFCKRHNINMPKILSDSLNLN